MNHVMLKDKQLLVKVFYSGVNRADISQNIGKYLPPKDHCQDLGLEVMGQVVQCGSNVSSVNIKDFVFGLVNGGGYNDYCVMEEDLTILKPEELDCQICASIPEVFMTAIYNLLFLGRMEAGQVVLIHAGASGVGLAVIQVAKLLGFKVIATTRSKNKEQICKDYNADLVVNTQDNNFIEIIKNKFDTINLIIDPVLGSFTNIDLELLVNYGKLICLGLLGGNNASIDCSLILRKNLGKYPLMSCK